MNLRIMSVIAAFSIIAGCGGGGGGDADPSGPVTSGAQVQQPALSDVRAADPSRTEAAAARAAANLPNFGSVTQSSNGGTVSGITTDAATTSFDGQNVQVDVTRQDGSGIGLNSFSNSYDDTYFSSGIRSHTDGRTWTLVDFTNANLTAASVTVT